MPYKVIKKIEGKYTFWQVVDKKGEVFAEFESYNFQKPARQAKELADKLNKLSK
jgi:hypothetical protein